MIVVVQPVPAAAAVVDPGGRVLAFAASVRRLRAWRAALDAGLRALLVLALPAIALVWLVPRSLVVALLGAVVLAGIAALCSALRARAVADARLLRGDAGVVVTGDLGILGDELATWLEAQRGPTARQPMATWLGEDVVARLPAADAGTMKDVGRSRLGRLRHLVPLVILLLLAWLLSFLLQPEWPGLLGGKPEPVQAPSTGNGIVPVPVPTPGDGSQPENQRPPPKPRPNQRPDPPPPQPPDEPKAEADQPAPLLNLPEQKRFVVPEHIDDGPTRRMRVHAAELAEEGAAAAPRPAQAPGGQGEATPPPPPTKETFERALEQALRSRHVPAEERAMVKRFFELLHEAAK
jgi:hypothetical protein